MKLQELLAYKGINLERTRLIRHNLSNKEVAAYYNQGQIETYQTIQKPSCFKNFDYVVSFLGTEGTNGVFLGCYKVNGFSEYDASKLPDDFTIELDSDTDCVIFHLEPTDILEEFKNRLVIDWGKGTINWCQNGTTEKEILEIRPAVSEVEFINYDKVLLSFETLRNIVYHKAAYKEWEDKLSAVAGVYLITDTKTGKHYVGSASGLDGGIWGRWSEYARTKHGGNKRLVELITADPDYCYNFQYSILEVFPLKRDKQEVLEYEQLYKKKLWSIQFGLNDNL